MNENMCYICAKSGQKSRLRLFQINLTEAVRLCSREKCTYPFDSVPCDELIVERDALAVTSGRLKKSQCVSPTKLKYSKNSGDRFATEKKSSGLHVVRNKEDVSSSGTLETSTLCHSMPYFKSSISTKNKTFESYSHTDKIKTNIDCDMNVNNSVVFDTSLHPKISPLNLSSSPGPEMGSKVVTAANQVNSSSPANSVVDSKICNSILKIDSQLETSNRLAEINTDKLKTSVNPDNQTDIQESSFVINKTETDCGDNNGNTVSKQSQSVNFVYLQWQNRDAMCWLDVLMCMLVHSKTIQTSIKSGQVSSESIIGKLVATYNKTIEMINMNVTCQKADNLGSINNNSFEGFHASSGFTKCCFNLLKSERTSTVQTGAGIRSSIAKMILQGNYGQAVLEPHFSVALKYLHDIREDLFKYVQPKLQCVKGKNDSPVFAMPILLKENKDIEQLFKLTYTTVFKCNHCGFSQREKLEKTLPSFQSTVADFRMQEPCFEQCCFQCRLSGQPKKLIFESVPEIVLMHFIEGIPFSDVERLDFVENGVVYSVTAVVQYKKNPDHFVTWIHNLNDSVWMECDDLKSPLCQPQNRKPTFQPKQIHIVMWEKSTKPLPNTITCTPAASDNKQSEVKTLSESITYSIPTKVPDDDSACNRKAISVTQVPSNSGTTKNASLENFRTVQSILLTKQSQSRERLSTQSSPPSCDSLKHAQKPEKVSPKPLGNLELLRKVTHLQRRRARNSIQNEEEATKTDNKDKKCNIKATNNKRRNSNTFKDESRSLAPSETKKPMLKLGNLKIVAKKSHMYYSCNSPVSLPKKNTFKRGKVFEGYVPKSCSAKSEVLSSVKHSHLYVENNSHKVKTSSEPSTHSISCLNHTSKPIIFSSVVSTNTSVNSYHNSLTPVSSQNLKTLHSLLGKTKNSDNLTKQINSSENNDNDRNTFSNSPVNVTPNDNDEAINNANDDGFLSSEEMEEISSKVDDDFLAQITDMSFTELSSAEPHSQTTGNTNSEVSSFLPLSNERECQILQELYTALCIPAPSGTNDGNKC